MQDGVDMILCTDHFFHVDSFANEGDFSIDKLQRVERLVSRGESAIREERIALALKSKFFNGVPAADWKAM